jgi:hypothetical protein
MRRKNAAAVALGRKGGLKGGPARAALLTPEQRSQSAKKAVTARWAKAKGQARIASSTATKKNATSTNRKTMDPKRVKKAAPAKIDASDSRLVNLLNRLKATVEPTEIRELSDQIERVVFHKQFMNA